MSAAPSPANHGRSAGGDWVPLRELSEGTRRQELWRLHSDAVNTAWLIQRLPMPPVQRLLKTDLFDEALTAGLYPSLCGRARTVIGIDVEASTVGAARKRDAGLRGVAADVRSLPFAGATFDGVVSNSTLDHFTSTADIAISLQELGRVLRPGGLLLLTLDNLANPVVALRNALPFRALHALGIVPYPVGTTYGPRQLRRAVREAGFEVLEIGAILHCPRILAVAAAGILERYGSARARQRFSAYLMPFERLAGWRTRFFTGYFVAIVARRR